MIKGKSVLAIIPARGGSKGVPRKNIRNLAGKPLIAWTIEEAKKSKYIDRLILSSEDAEIIEVAKKWGCEVPFIRPEELAQDDTPGIEPVLHALSELPRYEFVMLLQPTSPFRTAEDIDGVIEACLSNNSETCVSISEVEKSPYWMYEVTENNIMKPLLNPEQNYNSRQLLPTINSLNGAIYLSSCDWLRKGKRFINDKTLPYVMPGNRSIDIDTELDFIVAESMMDRKVKQTNRLRTNAYLMRAELNEFRKNQEIKVVQFEANANYEMAYLAGWSIVEHFFKLLHLLIKQKQAIEDLLSWDSYISGKSDDAPSNKKNSPYPLEVNKTIPNFDNDMKHLLANCNSIFKLLDSKRKFRKKRNSIAHKADTISKSAYLKDYKVIVEKTVNELYSNLDQVLSDIISVHDS